MSRVDAFSRRKSLRARGPRPASGYPGAVTRRRPALGAIAVLVAACSENVPLAPTGGAGHHQSEAQAGSPAVHRGGATGDTPTAGAGGSASSGQAGAELGGQGGAAAGANGGASGGSSVEPGHTTLAVRPARALWTGVRHYAGSTPSGRTNGPAAPPERVVTVHNEGAAPIEVQLELTGADADRFTLVSPDSGRASIPAGSELSVRVSLTTSDALLPKAPAQDDGATVLTSALRVTSGGAALALDNYALVLTYAELEPTFGQILGAFPQWTTRLPSWLVDDANPNPGSPLPPRAAGTDEVDASAFQRLDASKPVTLQPLARFSPPGLVPFGWYTPGKAATRRTIGTLAEQADPHTNDKSRLLEPPLASGGVSFEPTNEPFAVWMEPVGVGLLSSVDADGFDGQHRVRVWTLRDASGEVIDGAFLVGGEEAANGDYQDYVFLLGNAALAP